MVNNWIYFVLIFSNGFSFYSQVKQNLLHITFETIIEWEPKRKTWQIKSILSYKFTIFLEIRSQHMFLYIYKMISFYVRQKTFVVSNKEHISSTSFININHNNRIIPFHLYISMQEVIVSYTNTANHWYETLFESKLINN